MEHFGWSSDVQQANEHERLRETTNSFMFAIVDTSQQLRMLRWRNKLMNIVGKFLTSHYFMWCRSKFYEYFKLSNYT